MLQHHKKLTRLQLQDSPERSMQRCTSSAGAVSMGVFQLQHCFFITQEIHWSFFSCLLGFSVQHNTCIDGLFWLSAGVLRSSTDLWSWNNSQIISFVISVLNCPLCRDGLLPDIRLTERRTGRLINKFGFSDIYFLWHYKLFVWRANCSVCTTYAQYEKIEARLWRE